MLRADALASVGQILSSSWQPVDIALFVKVEYKSSKLKFCQVESSHMIFDKPI
jgi:hypothetical protein